MRELPALFSTLMVEAILENRKKMTRRTGGLETINQHPDKWRFDGHAFDSDDEDPTQDMYFEKLDNDGNPAEYYVQIYPKYKIGDHLWVREAHKITWINSYWSCEFKDGIVNRKYYKEISLKTNHRLTKRKRNGKWVNSMFLPKEFSRIWLEVTNVKCERLQDISQEDCIAEGIEKAGMLHWRNYLNESYITPKPIESFQTLWQSINGKDSWDLNPWVFVYEFKIIKK